MRMSLLPSIIIDKSGARAIMELIVNRVQRSPLDLAMSLTTLKMRRRAKVVITSKWFKK
jgi:hypothetical protein